MSYQSTHILPETPAMEAHFNKLLPLHLELNRNTRLASGLANLTITAPVNSFIGADGSSPTDRVYGFNANGIATAGPAMVAYSSGQPLGIPLFYVDGVITGNPASISPSASNVQYVGTQITTTEFLLDIKEPYVRL
jgi:hypothetical protein